MKIIALVLAQLFVMSIKIVNNKSRNAHSPTMKTPYMNLSTVQSKKTSKKFPVAWSVVFACKASMMSSKMMSWKHTGSKKSLVNSTDSTIRSAA